MRGKVRKADLPSGRAHPAKRKNGARGGLVGLSRDAKHKDC